MANNEKIAKEVAKGVIGFLEKNHKLDLLERVIELLQEKKQSYKVFVRAPRILSKEERTKVKSLLDKLDGDGKKEVVFVKDETLIDGIKIESKDKIWDFSLSNQLSRFKKV